jgi:hypothetical protein
MIETSARDDRARRLKRSLLAAAFTALLATLLGGCALIKSTSSTQLNTIGDVQVTTTICAGDTNSNNTGYNPADPACQGSGKGGNVNGDAVNGTYQVSLAYRIPSGANGPASFTSTNTSGPPATPCGGGVVFTQNSGLANAFEALSPAGSGKKWVAYYSTTQNYSNSGCQYQTVSPRFTLSQAYGVVPFQGPFTYRPVLGWRQVDNNVAANGDTRAASCGSSLTAQYNDGVDGSDSDSTPDMLGICADDPAAATISNSAADLTQSTRDLGVIPSANASVQAGSTAQVSFLLSYKGAALPSGQFNLAGNTTIAGATATPSVPSLTPGADSDATVNVNVPVPASTPPGTYNVFLIATLSSDGSQARGGIAPATITVGEAFGLSPAPALPSLGTIALNGRSQTKNATMSGFGVIDSPGSSDQGWNVTVVGDSSAGKSKVFKEYCPTASCGGGHSGPGYIGGGFTLAANSLTLNTSTGSWSGGSGAAPSFSCNSGSCAIDAATPTKIASAPVGGGTALWTAAGFGSSSLRLATATTMRALTSGEQYHLDVVWTLNSGP